VKSPRHIWLHWFSAGAQLLSMPGLWGHRFWPFASGVQYADDLSFGYHITEDDSSYESDGLVPIAAHDISFTHSSSMSRSPAFSISVATSFLVQ
jgi:hypothetical protein